MRNQKGITLLILMIMIVVMSVIVGSISYSSITGYRMNNYYSMCSDIELLDEKIAIYFLENKELPIVESDAEDEDVPDGSTKDIYTLIDGYGQDNVNYNPNNSAGGTLYKINLSLLENLSLNHTEYYIDKASHTIYSATGAELDDAIYYTIPFDYETISPSAYQS